MTWELWSMWLRQLGLQTDASCCICRLDLSAVDVERHLSPSSLKAAVAALAGLSNRFFLSRLPFERREQLSSCWRHQDSLNLVDPNLTSLQGRPARTQQTSDSLPLQRGGEARRRRQAGSAAPRDSSTEAASVIPESTDLPRFVKSATETKSKAVRIHSW